MNSRTCFPDVVKNFYENRQYVHRIMDNGLFNL